MVFVSRYWPNFYASFIKLCGLVFIFMMPTVFGQHFSGKSKKLKRLTKRNVSRRGVKNLASKPFSLSSHAEVRYFTTTLRKALDRSFEHDTQQPGTLRNAPLSAGHCAAVSVLLVETFGMTPISSSAPGISHWFSRIRLTTGLQVDVDVTGDQFGLETERIGAPGRLFSKTRIRSLRDVNKDTWERAAVLARRLALVPMRFSYHHHQQLLQAADRLAYKATQARF